MRLATVLKLAAALALIALVAVAAVLKSIDIDIYRNILISSANMATGRTLTIKGAVNLEFSFSPVIVAEDVTLANASWGSRPEMIKAKRIEVSLGLIPLFSRELRLDRLLLVEPDILLEKDAKGQANWRFDSEGTIPVEQGDDSFFDRVSLSIAEMAIQRGRLEWREGKKTAHVLDVRKLALETSSPTAPLGISGEGRWNGRDLTVSGVLGPVAELRRGGTPYPVKLKLALPHLVALVDGALADDGKGARQFDLKVESTIVDLTEAGKLIGLDFPALGPARLSFLLNGTLNAPVIRTIDAAFGRKDHVWVLAKGGINDPLDGKGIALDLTLEGRNLKDAGRAFGVALPGVGPVALSGHLSGTTGRLKLANLAGTIGKSDVSGHGTVVIHPSVSETSLILSSHRVDAAEWYAAIETERAVSARPSSSRLFGREPLPWDILDGPPLSLEWHIDRLDYRNLAAETVAIRAGLKDRRIQLFKSAGSVAGGQLKVRFDADGAAFPPKLALAIRGDSIDAGRLFTALGITGAVDGGRTDLRIRLNGQGDSLHTVMAGLDGSTLMVSDAARIRKVRAEMLVVDLLGALLPASSGKDTDMRCLVSQFSIKDGLAKSETLLFDTANMTVQGQGSINLANERLDMTLMPKGKNASMASLTVPLDVGGTLANPSVTPDKGAIATGIVGAVGGLALVPFDILWGGLSSLGGGGGTAKANPCVLAAEQTRDMRARSRGQRADSPSIAEHLKQEVRPE